MWNYYIYSCHYFYLNMPPGDFIRMLPHEEDNKTRLHKLCSRIDSLLCGLPNFLQIVAWTDIKKKIDNGYFFVDRLLADMDEYVVLDDACVFSGIDWTLLTNELSIFVGQNVGVVRLFAIIYYCVLPFTRLHLKSLTGHMSFRCLFGKSSIWSEISWKPPSSKYSPLQKLPTSRYCGI